LTKASAPGVIGLFWHLYSSYERNRSNRPPGASAEVSVHRVRTHCCGKSLIGTVLVGFGVRQHARAESLSKRAPSSAFARVCDLSASYGEMSREGGPLGHLSVFRINNLGAAANLTCRISSDQSLLENGADLRGHRVSRSRRVVFVDSSTNALSMAARLADRRSDEDHPKCCCSRPYSSRRVVRVSARVSVLTLTDTPSRYSRSIG